MRNVFGAGIFLLFALSSCLDTPNFDNTPSIRFNGITKDLYFDTFQKAEVDSVIITVNFEDGDGDLGVGSDQRDTLLSWGNYRLRTFVQNTNGEFKERVLEIEQQKWFPVLKENGKPGPIKGKLDLKIGYPRARFTKPMVVKYQVQIRDRALHESNVVETDTTTVYLF